MDSVLFLIDIDIIEFDLDKKKNEKFTLKKKNTFKSKIIITNYKYKQYYSRLFCWCYHNLKLSFSRNRSLNQYNFIIIEVWDFFSLFLNLFQHYSAIYTCIAFEIFTKYTI